jgi:hypothetical protein
MEAVWKDNIQIDLGELGQRIKYGGGLLWTWWWNVRLRNNLSCWVAAKLAAFEDDLIF